MLTHGQAAADGSEYYQEGHYYYKDHAPATWMGEGANALGLKGAMQQSDLEHFDRMLHGQLPNEVKMADPPNGRARRKGDDFTFSAPKSASLVALVGQDRRVIEAWDRAVAAGVQYIEKEIFGTRDREGNHVHAGAIVGTFRHETSRPIRDSKGVMHADPQLHTHCVFLNAALRSDGQWRAADYQLTDGIKRAADAVTLGQFASDLQRFGYELVPTKDAYEVKGISQETIDAFSRRAKQVEDELAKVGLTRDTASDLDRERANLRSRAGKESLSQENQLKDWQLRAREQGRDIAPTVATAQEHAPTAGQKFEEDRELRARRAVESATQHLSERQSVFTTDRLVGQSTVYGMSDGVTLQDVTKSLRETIGTTVVTTRTPDVLTTPETLQQEREILEIAQRGQGTQKPAMSSLLAQRWTGNYPHLTPGQREAVVLGLTTSDRVVIVQGWPGTGKTTTLDTLHKGLEEQSQSVRGLAPSAVAARELHRGAHVEATTIASWLRTKDEDGHHTYLVDEAGMVSTRDLRNLLVRAEQEGSRVILIGDPRQLSSVEAGAPLRALIQDGVPTVTMREILRQRDVALRDVVATFSEGKAREAALKAAPYMREVRGKTTLAQAVTKDYLSRSPESRQHTIVLSGTNATRRAVNHQVHKGLQREGTVDKVELRVRTLYPVDATHEERTRAQHYKPGDVVVPRKDYLGPEGAKDGLRRGEEYTVVRSHHGKVILQQEDARDRISWDPSTIRDVGHYHEEHIRLSAGDRVIFRENDRKLKVINGDTGSVTRLNDGEAWVHLDRADRDVQVGADDGARLTYGYAVTVHAAQGVTTDHVVVAAERSGAELANVALSRERETVTVYTRDIGRTQREWGVWNGQENALDHMTLEQSWAWQNAHEPPGTRTEHPSKRPRPEDDDQQRRAPEMAEKRTRTVERDRSMEMGP